MPDLLQRLKTTLADRYRVEREIGRGGMATVFVAEDLRHKRQVAIKVLHPELSAALGPERFLREIEIAARLQYPHILPVHDSGESEGLLYYVMPFVESGSLRDRLTRDGRLPLDEVVRLAEQVAAALGYAHDRGVVHRDVKPENIMMVGDQAALADFGLARVLEAAGGERLTRSGLAMGTPAYMSPEQALGEGEVDGRSDIYSLGCVLYEAITGRAPFEAPTFLALLARHASDPPPSVRATDPAIPAGVDRALRRALAKSPGKRFASARELAASLRTGSVRVDPQPVTEPAAHGSPRSRAAPQTTSHTVGRQDVLDRLDEELARIRASGRGRMIGLTGEPGIGKTTVADAFLEGLSDGSGAVTLARGRCSERLAGAEAYLPLLEALDSLLHGLDGPALAVVVRQTAPSWYRQLAPGTAASVGGNGPGAFSQERLKRELALLFEELATDRPLVVFIEDLHWADVASVDALGYVADRLDRTAAMVLATYRPEDMKRSDHPFLQVKPTFEQRGTLVELPLGFLGLDDVRRYLSLELEGHDLPDGLAALIHAKSEGSPLFMADLLRDLRRRGVVAERDGRWTLTGSLDAVGRELPESIRSMIGRKVDQLGASERAALLAASVQGEEFDASVVASALGEDPADLEEGLEEVARTQALIRRIREREFPDGSVTLRYRFVHVLYQNALYDSLTPARRIALSRAVAGALEARYPDDTSPVAAELALLHETGRDPERAAACFLAAARNAERVFAHHEVVHLAGRGIAALSSLPESTERSRRELAFRTILAPSIMTVSGWASPDAAENNRRLELLCRELGDDREVFAMLCGLLGFHLVADKPARARPPGEECLRIADRLGDPALQHTANAAFGDVLWLLGEFESARRHQETALELWRRRDWDSLPVFYAQHPVITSLGSGAWTLMWLGFPDRALQSAREAVEVVRELSHPFSSPFALNYLAHVHEFRGEMREADEAVDRLVAADEQGLPYFHFEALCLRGRLLARRGAAHEGIRKLREGLALSEAGGFLIWDTRTRVWLAEALGDAGHAGEAIELLDTGIRSVAEGGTRTFLAELHRARGDLLRRDGRDADAERSYQSALEVARAQAARGFELRAAVRLGRLLRDRGDIAQARSLVGGIHDWFTEGHDTADLMEARTLLEELAA